MTAGSISNCVEVDRGNAVLLAEERGDLLVLDEPHLDEVVAELPPVGLLWFKACWSCSGVIRFSLRRSSPMRTGMNLENYQLMTKFVNY